MTVGFESNIQINSDCKASKNSPLFMDLKHAGSDVKFVNLSMSTIGVMANSPGSLLLLLDDLNSDKSYVFCCRNKPWKNPDLLEF